MLVIVFQQSDNHEPTVSCLNNAGVELYCMIVSFRELTGVRRFSHQLHHIDLESRGMFPGFFHTWVKANDS